MYVCVYVCVSPWVAQRDRDGGGGGGGENTQGIRDLLITLCSVSPFFSLPPSFLGLPFSARLFIEGCRGQCFWLCSVLQASSDLPSLKTPFQRLIECTIIIIMEGEHDGNKLQQASSFLFTNALSCLTQLHFE